MKTLKKMFGSFFEDMNGECFMTKAAIVLAVGFILLLPGFVFLLAMCCGMDELDERINGK